ncbi:DEAD/DEAH box helicase [Plantibacter sp. VKM Ac-2885]|uniref:DEAD/DEAH box helicase n=1 Tax=Plantibacter sp. VKM Ac-2885 TaxID=2783828 RepID=UPI00188C4067|nr:DEAD/DEAH box helicase [Plantibacter sp. VKM Ac-2885]MBF4512068.1 DEAD/DEAH box helicase [Plantibacter sp. VKM Ac-2885]
MTPEPAPLVDVADLVRLVGRVAFDRGRVYARDGRVTAADWDPDKRRLRGIVEGSTDVPYACIIDLGDDTGGFARIEGSACSCPLRGDCKHIVATLLHSNAAHLRAEGRSDRWVAPQRPPSGKEASWRSDRRWTAPINDPALDEPAEHQPMYALDELDDLPASWRPEAERRAARWTPSPQTPPAPPSWRNRLDSLAGDAGRATAPTAMGLQFEVRESIPRTAERWRGPTSRTADGPPEPRHPRRIAVRPVVKKAGGGFVKSTISWTSFTHQGHRLSLDPAHQQWFTQFQALLRATRPPAGAYAGAGDSDWLVLDDFGSPVLWHLFEEASQLGIELVGTRKGTVTLGATAAIRLDAAHDDDGVVLRPVVTIDGTDVDAATSGALGDHGLYHYTLEPQQAIVLAPLAEPLTDEARGLLGPGEPVVVPEAEVPEFLEHYVPRLRRSISLSSTDGTVALPEIVPPVLVLTASFEPKQTLRLAWFWQYAPAQRVPIGGGTPALAAGRPLVSTVPHGVPTDAATGGPAAEVLRDERSERAILDRVGAAIAAAAEPERRALAAGSFDELTTPGVWPPRPQVLTEFDAALVTERTLPVLESLDDVLVEVSGDRPEYRELTGTPHISVTTVETEQRDWFDLGIVIHIGEYSVPFEPLFKALSKGRTKLLMVDHTYLSLEHPAFDRLRELLTEAAALKEWETKPSISRYQASLWADFEDLADETEQAVSWREAAAGLNAIEAVPDTPLPSGLHADLRPYQVEGFRWLAFLWQHGLGGILADDMGLGKTLQTLALVAHARETTGTTAPPFLVVAPTSVVSNWVAEAARFVPDLVVRSIATTQAKGSASIADISAGADIVVTSYALFRLDAPAYQAVEWSGLILDEAQFVKNHRAKLHECAVDLRAPFKLAITGTPIENTLMELWSLLSIVAPGLFASAPRFTEHYVKPIGKGLDSSRLQTLRRRIRPLLMRRTKEMVAPELPPKQEQVLRIELAPAHRKLYDLVLQRERQKLLGLVDDLDRNRFIVFRSLTLLRMLSLDASLIDAEEHAGIPSSKLDALLEQLDDVVAEGHRALIFSQFTSFLGTAARRLEEQGIAYEYLDGSTRRRGEVIDRFRTGDAPVFLISLKAGGFGLNLTEADYVFLLDPWWNPAAEAQAIDRTHRIGQTENVMVYRLVAADTIEEKVMALQAKKSELFAAVLDDDAVFSQALTAEDIRGLLE